jgi:hypothetical protein
MNILIIILLFLATRGIFALFDDLKKVIWFDRPKKEWNSFTGYDQPEWKKAGFKSEKEWMQFIKDNC